MYKRVVVGVDGSPSSVSASKYAFDVGRHLDIPVVGIYVIDERLLEESFLADLAGVLGFTFYEGISSKVKEFFEKQADLVLTEFSALGREWGVNVSLFQTTGVPYEVILNQADREDLIVLGKKSRKPVKGFLLGSTADIVSRRSASPVLLVPEDYKKPWRAVVAYDGSPNSRLALEACRSFRDIYGFNMVVLHVGDREVSLENLEVVNLKGIPEEVIVSYAKDKADMLFMGAFSKGRLREIVLGSITSFVVHNLDIPIYLSKGSHS